MNQIAPAAVLLLELERLYESFFWSTFASFSLFKLILNSQYTGITLRAEGLYESFPVAAVLLLEQKGSTSHFLWSTFAILSRP